MSHPGMVSSIAPFPRFGFTEAGLPQEPVAGEKHSRSGEERESGRRDALVFGAGSKRDSTKEMVAVVGGEREGGEDPPSAGLWARRPQSAAPASPSGASPIARSEEGSSLQTRIGGL